MMSTRSSTVTIDDLVKCCGVFDNSYTFDYKLNDKTAKSKLVKGAKREALEIQRNSTSISLLFSGGSWQFAVLPSYRYWNQVKSDQACKVGDISIKVAGTKSGKDASGRNIVNQIIFYVDRDKIVCHLYNTTQRILVNGHGYQQSVL